MEGQQVSSEPGRQGDERGREETTERRTTITSPPPNINGMASSCTSDGSLHSPQHTTHNTQHTTQKTAVRRNKHLQGGHRTPSGAVGAGVSAAGRGEVSISALNSQPPHFRHSADEFRQQTQVFKAARHGCSSRHRFGAIEFRHEISRCTWRVFAQCKTGVFMAAEMGS